MAKRNEIVGNIPNGQTLGEWIRAARLGSEFPTQVAFAAALGLKQAHLSKLERGDLRPSREVLNRIARLTQRALGDRQAVLELDGLRLDWPDAWVHVRPSNTEPIVRVIGEAADERRVEALVASHVERVRELGAEGAV